MRNVIHKLCGHFDWYLRSAPLDGYGSKKSAMWISALDLNTGRYPAAERPSTVSKRCYRYIESPWGSNCYWDQPVFVALEALSSATGNPAYAESASTYVRDFLDTCISGKNGIFLWGNHYYYDAVKSGVVFFPGSIPPALVDPAKEEGGYCETRPLAIDWEVFWKCDAQKTEAAIAAQARGAIVDSSTGEFNRHSDGLSGYPFLESGGILVMSLLWLYNKTGNNEYLEMSRKVAGYSYSYRDPGTGLMINAPGVNRWDGIISTSEVGMWARCLQNASRISEKPEFSDMAISVLESWLRYSWSESDRQFYGKLLVKDGQPRLEESDTEYQPDRFCNPWHPLFPRHDYPFQCAQACLEAYKITGREIFRISTERWIEVMERSINSSASQVRYAEHYGRFIKLLHDTAVVLELPDYRQKANEVAEHSLRDLLVENRFRTHTHELRYDSVDGFGFLALALLNLHSDCNESMSQWIF